MWNSRFAAVSRDPFDNTPGFFFPAPEGMSLSYLPHLLTAQAFIPPTERTEVAGFDFPGDNDAIRAEVLRRLNAVPEYRKLFGRSFPGSPQAQRSRSTCSAGRSPSSSSRSRSPTPRSTASRGDSARAHRPGEAWSAPVLRRGGLRVVPRGLGRVERDVQRLQRARARRPAARAGVRTTRSTDPCSTKTSVASS